MSLTCPLCGGNLEYVRNDNYRAIFICKGESCELGGHGMSAETWLTLAEQQRAWRELRELSQDESIPGQEQIETPALKSLNHSKPMTMAEYQAIESPDPNTVYHIVDDTIDDSKRLGIIQKKLDKAMELLDEVKEICAKNKRYLTVAKISVGKQAIEDIKE